MATVPPRSDLTLNVWTLNFSTRLSSTPTAFGILASDASAYAALSTDYATKLATALNTTTRNKGSVAAKNTSKAALLAKARQLIKMIGAYPPLTAQQRADLGLNPADTVPTPVPPPSTRPLVTVNPVGGLRIVDETTPTRRAKPSGVIGALVYSKISLPADPPPTGIEEASFAEMATRANVTLTLPAGSNNKTLYVFAQWVNDKGERGPVSIVASTAIAA
jgi:hypothetical protein